MESNNKQQTAMQQLIQWMEERSQVIPFAQEDCYDKAMELLKTEKEQITTAYAEGGFSTLKVYAEGKKYIAPEEYYNKTHNYKKEG